MQINFCPRCGTKTEPQAFFCRQCGSKLSDDQAVKQEIPATPVGTQPSSDIPKGQVLKDKKFIWSWVFKSAGLIAIALIGAIILLTIIALTQNMDMENEEALLVPAVICVIGALFLGSMWAAYLSPGRTIFEPAVGAALVVVLINLLSGDAAGILLGWILPFGIGVGGAMVGERLQKNKKH